MNDRQVNRHIEARERVARVREVELDTLRDLVATLDDTAATRFAALERASIDVDLAIGELATAGSALAERARVSSPKPAQQELESPQTPQGEDPQRRLCRTGEGSASPCAHCPTIGGRVG